MTKITKEELLEILSRRKGVQFCSVTWESQARLRKTGNPHPNCKKRTQASLELGTNYKRKLEKALANSGAEPSSALTHDRSWGTRVDGTPFIRHTGKDGIERFYLDAVINKVIETQYEDETGPLLYDEVKEFLPNKDSSFVKVSNICVDNIKSIKVNGESYEII